MDDALKVLLGFAGILLLLWLLSGGPSRPGAYVPERTNSLEKPELSISLPSLESMWQQGTSTPDLSRSPISLSIPGGSASTPEKEYAVIDIEAGPDVRTLLTGWVLKSDNTGISTTLGKGAYVPVLGAINPQENIYLTGSAKAIVSSGRSPLGVSFEENRCTGFLAHTYQFEPPLEKHCPAAETLVGVVDRSCSDYLRGLSICQIPTALPSYLSNECRTAITEKLNYNSCVSAIRDTRDFSTRSWRIYQQVSTDLWRDSRDFVRLIDRLGKTIQTAGY